MTRWRLAVAAVLALLVGVPLALPFAALAREPAAWAAWAEADRLLALAGNTCRLILGTLALALPLGIAGAILLYRTDLPLRRALRFLTFLTLFIPLPLFASAWQAALGTGGWLPVALWSTPAPETTPDPDAIPWKPWAQGLAAAIWVHGVAALPWVIVLVGQGLCWVERELEEDALTVAGPVRMLWAVTLRRARAAVAAAAVWVALLAATEITVTDMMQVRTFAEEVYTQFVLGDRAALARAVAAAVPSVLLAWGIVVVAAGRWERTLPPRAVLDTSPLLLMLGWRRWPLLVLILAVIGILAGVPVASLVWKAGVAGSPQTWSASVAVQAVASAFRVRGLLLVESLGVALAAGVVTASLGLTACWLALRARWWHAGLLGLLAVVWAMPGPVIGIGLRQTIGSLVDLAGTDSAVARALYYGPSPLPLGWAYLVRLLPAAVALLWPVVRLVPPELLDAARLEGAYPGQELRFVVWPLARAAWLRAGLAVAVLALGEVSASKLVETPGAQLFAQEVFTQMHYGVTNNLAGLCLLLLLAVLGGAAAAAPFLRWYEAGEVTPAARG